MSDIKAYFLIRKDLNMSIAKLAVQVGHGVDFIHRYANNAGFLHYSNWLESDRKKIVLQVKNDVELEKIRKKLEENYIYYQEIVDNGLTELNGKTLTGIVITPINQEDVPNYIKRLRLYVQ